MLLLWLLAGPSSSSQAAGLDLPAQIVTGSRLIYEAGSATQADFNTAASAGVGLTRYEVVAVTPAKVLLRAGSFLNDGRGYSFGGGSFVVVDALAMKTGASIWIDPTTLAGFTTDSKTTVTDFGWPAAGQEWKARSITHLSPDSASRQVFDSSSGLLLAQQLASGQQRPGTTDPFMRQNTSSLAFVGQRAVELPWAGGTDPAWTRTVRRLVYQGQQGLAGGYGPSISTPLRHRVEITERGEGWALGTLTVETQGQPATQLPTGSGPGGLGAWWVDPAKMAALPPGVIDRDPTLGTTLSFERSAGPQGPVGIVRESGSSHLLTWVYDLQDGALVYASFEQTSFGMKTELSLSARE
mgnify:CR=1 FL=1